MATAILPRLEPPSNEQPLREDGGRHTQAWADYHESIADRVNTLADTVRQGITDGSDADAGNIGEYLFASNSGVPLGGSGTATNVATLDLTAGDWDVEGNVAFATTGATTAVIAGVNTASATFGFVYTHHSGTLGTGAPHRIGTGGAQRMNVPIATTVFLVAASSGGGATASGAIWARRAR